MNKILLILLCLLNIFLFSFQRLDIYTVERITAECSKIYNKKWGITLAGNGGKMMDDMQEIFLHYNSSNPCNISLGREILIDIVEKIITPINENKLIRPYLRNYPITSKNFEIIIGFGPKEGKRFDPPSLSIITLKENYIFYSIYNSEQKTFDKIHQELYEDAQKIIKNKLTIN